MPLGPQGEGAGRASEDAFDVVRDDRVTAGADVGEPFENAVHGLLGDARGGPRTKASHYEEERLPMCLQLRFRPGAARPLFRVSVRELAGRA
ncbi:hypothetical protein AB0M68_02730 [Streptomyces sp. NPDC051453]|uniref:hypothetical protein n=1 Tax=Streptomyces sp. NPDC051453 TaxID=3154941 RepID=UPI003423C894